MVDHEAPAAAASPPLESEPEPDPWRLPPIPKVPCHVAIAPLRVKRLGRSTTVDLPARDFADLFDALAYLRTLPEAARATVTTCADGTVLAYSYAAALSARGGRKRPMVLNLRTRKRAGAPPPSAPASPSPTGEGESPR